ncbi:hypothetical protein OBBRIDRAFT_776376 [Obba rivulosa]|uniref:Alpha/beta hydrolase fold-3 domain-containing protein n=1 Tax=Obba rivulosa TaxID=1052685 RepID=A0A8E2AUE8_9APHY|nr:hypothetical protein OBBRIDRAFT_776376 [Obba rivulosa]
MSIHLSIHYSAENSDADSEYEMRDYEVPVQGCKSTIRSIKPVDKDAANVTFPLLYWIHFGGWVLGSIEIEDYFLRMICVKLKISIVSLEYRLAPEYKFPVQNDDCYTGLKWAVENASLLSADLSKGFIVGGASAGAHLSAVMTHRAKQDPFFFGKSITGQVLQIPSLMHPNANHPERRRYKDEHRSMEDNKDIPGIDPKSMREMFDHWDAPPNDPEASPCLYPDQTGLPPAYFQLCELDPMRDDGVLYERLLREAGNKTKLDMYPGLPHLFHYLFPSVSMATKFEEDFKDGMCWLLEAGSSI